MAHTRSTWIVALLGLVGTAHAAGGRPACTCAVKPQILYRIQEIRAILTAFEAQIARIGDGPRFTNAAYDSFRDTTLLPMLNSMKASSPASARTWAGSTHPFTCKSTFPSAATSCLREALERHEAHHANLCQSASGKVDYRDGGSLADAYREELVAYRIELDYLEASLATLPDSCKPDGWLVYYEVQVRGEGGKVRMQGEDAPHQITWRIDHTYLGTIDLDVAAPLNSQAMMAQFQKASGPMTPQQIQALKQQIMANRGWRPSVATIPIDVAIDDEIVTFDHDPGEGESYENKTLTQKWKGAGQDSVQAAFEVDENTTAGTYNVTLSIKPSGHGGTVTVDEAEVFDRTALGYGGAPTHQEPPPTQRKVGFDKMVLPTVS